MGFITHPNNETRRFRYGLLRKVGLPVYLAVALRDWQPYAIKSHIKYFLRQINPELLPTCWQGEASAEVEGYTPPTETESGY